MSKHTPGPWKIVPRTRPFQMTISVESVNPRGYIARCIDAGTLGTPNAHLIAAAPDLLDALRDMLSGWKYIRDVHGDLYGVGWDRAQGKAEAALAKAQGGDHV